MSNDVERDWNTSHPARGSLRLAVVSGLVLVATFGWGLAFAQQPDPEGAPPVADADVSAEQMKAQASHAQSRIEAVKSQIQAMLDSAQEARNVVRVVCLTDKRNQLDLALATVKDRHAAMLGALGRGALTQARHEYRLLIVVFDRAEVLGTESNQCLGQEAGIAGESSLLVDIDPELPAPDPGAVPLAPIVAIVPVVASATD